MASRGLWAWELGGERKKVKGLGIMNAKIILPLDAQDATLEMVGGKGANLARLARAGHPVPGGFLITTEAYRSFVDSNDLKGKILPKIEGIQADDPEILKEVSDTIRAWFSAGTMSSELVTVLSEAYDAIGRKPVAVRSSATAEDLPDMSFAGQQDTFLNVVGDEDLSKAVVDCWSSLWTARAIGYRARNSIDHGEVELAVVVQEMVESEASGVLFTANPVTGVRSETVIDATLGLGEALVSGQVEPDHYVVDTTKDGILSKALGDKAVVIRGEADGGVVTVRENAGELQALPDEQILALVQLGGRVATEYDFPQDIEWAWAEGKLYLLQSRPITSLFPLVEGMEADPLRVLFSFGAVQGMLDPMTPLGKDAIRLLFAGGSSVFGYRFTHETQRVIKIAGERLWGDLTAVIKSTIGNKVARRALPLIEPSFAQALGDVWNDPRLQLRRPKLKTIWRLVRFALSTLRRALPNILDPRGKSANIKEWFEHEIAAFGKKGLVTGDIKTKLTRRVALFRELFYGFPRAAPPFGTVMLPGMVSLNILTQLTSHLPQTLRDEYQLGSDFSLKISRGLPHNVTTELDLYLWETTSAIRSDPESLHRFKNAPAQELASDYLAGRLPSKTQESVLKFMEPYGMRGVGEIDIGRPRWREDPTHIMSVLKGYLSIESETNSPEAVFERSAKAAQASIAQLEAAVRKTRGGRLKAKIVRAAARRFRAFAGFRESPKFFIIRMMGVVRKGLLESGKDFVEAGVLTRPDDLFYLYLNELEAFAKGDSRDWGALIAERRKNYDREKLRKQIPRMFLSDGRAFYEGISAPAEAGDGAIVGSPVSPGVVEGTVRVVLDPNQSQLAHGEILVCPGTDPAWTPLFLTAGGLVMEVGGMMSHGSVVAREYGIPAVVGVHQATTRLKTGQRIRVDGSGGQVVVLKEKSKIQKSKTG